MKFVVLRREGRVADLERARLERGELKPKLAGIVPKLAAAGDALSGLVAYLERRSGLVEILAELRDELCWRNGHCLIWAGARRNELGVAKRRAGNQERYKGGKRCRQADESTQ